MGATCNTCLLNSDPAGKSILSNQELQPEPIKKMASKPISSNIISSSNNNNIVESSVEQTQNYLHEASPNPDSLSKLSEKTIKRKTKSKNKKSQAAGEGVSHTETVHNKKEDGVTTSIVDMNRNKMPGEKTTEKLFGPQPIAEKTAGHKKSGSSSSASVKRSSRESIEESKKNLKKSQEKNLNKEIQQTTERFLKEVYASAIKILQQRQKQQQQLKQQQQTQQKQTQIHTSTISKANDENRVSGTTKNMQSSVRRGNENLNTLGSSMRQSQQGVESRSSRGVKDMNYIMESDTPSKYKVCGGDFVRINKTNVNENYQFLQKLGEGSYGSVHKALCIANKQDRAVKIIKKSKINKQESSLFSELEILKTLDHPNIIKLHEVYDYKDFYYVVTEYCDGGELFEAVKKSQRFSESDAAIIMRQLLGAVGYMHKRGIAHRDLKPENVVFSAAVGQNMKQAEIKIIDFGTAQMMQEGKLLHARVGSPYYVAPQVLAQNYNNKCDVWSCGVIMYVLLSGYPPFRGRSHEEIFNNIQKSRISFDGKDHFNRYIIPAKYLNALCLDKIWLKISKEAKDLVKKMLDRNYSRRVSAEACLNHAWLTNSQSSEPIGNQALLNMENFFFKNKFVAIVQTYLATNTVSQAERRALADKFKQIDKDGSGVIQRDELVEAYKSIYGIINEEVIAKIIATIDTNCSGQIDFTQFIVATYQHDKLFQRKSLEEAFNFFDQDKTGFIEVSELREILGDSCDNDEVKKIMDQLDDNGDNQISKEQFIEKLLPKE